MDSASRPATIVMDPDTTPGPTGDPIVPMAVTKLSLCAAPQASTRPNIADDLIYEVYEDFGSIC